MKSKEELLQNAQMELNQPNQAWEVSVEGDSIVAYWKWMDATFFAPTEITDEVKEYRFTVTLLDNGKWSEKDNSKARNINFEKGKISFGTSSFSGHQTEKSFTIGLGKDRLTNETGLIVNKFDTSIVKNAVRNYLTKYGWKKKGLFR